MDAFLAFRKSHAKAKELLELLSQANIPCLLPSHAYFEFAVASTVHMKREPKMLNSSPIEVSSIPNLKLTVVTLCQAYVAELLGELQGKPYPDLKSQDLIYFCIARNRRATLITEDRKLRNTARRGGLAAFEIAEAISQLHKHGEFASQVGKDAL